MKDLREEYQIILCWDVRASITFNATLLNLLLMGKIFKNAALKRRQEDIKKDCIFPYLFVFVVVLTDNT